jgi:hypothetical protein
VTVEDAFSFKFAACAFVICIGRICIHLICAIVVIWYKVCYALHLICILSYMPYVIRHGVQHFVLKAGVYVFRVEFFHLLLYWVPTPVFSCQKG